MMEDINNILNSGDVTGIYQEKVMQIIIYDVYLFFNNIRCFEHRITKILWLHAKQNVSRNSFPQRK